MDFFSFCLVLNQRKLLSVVELNFYCPISGTFSKSGFLFLLLLSSSFYQCVLLELVCTSFLSSLIRCKPILCPPPVSSHPTNTSLHQATTGWISTVSLLSSSPLFPLYPFSFLSSLSFFKMLIISPLLSDSSCCFPCPRFSKSLCRRVRTPRGAVFTRPL